MHEARYNQPFCRVERSGCRWYFGYNTKMKKFIAYSDTSGIATSAKIIDTLQELRDLMRWYLAHEWKKDRTWPENIKKFGSKKCN